MFQKPFYETFYQLDIRPPTLSQLFFASKFKVQAKTSDQNFFTTLKYFDNLQSLPFNCFSK